MYTPPVYFVVGLSDIGLFDLSVELSDLFVLSDYFVESSMQRFGQNNPISTVFAIPIYQCQSLGLDTIVGMSFDGASVMAGVRVASRSYCDKDNHFLVHYSSIAGHIDSTYHLSIFVH